METSDGRSHRAPAERIPVTSFVVVFAGAGEETRARSPMLKIAKNSCGTSAGQPWRHGDRKWANYLLAQLRFILPFSVSQRPSSATQPLPILAPIPSQPASPAGTGERGLTLGAHVRSPYTVPCSVCFSRVSRACWLQMMPISSATTCSKGIADRLRLGRRALGREAGSLVSPCPRHTRDVNLPPTRRHLPQRHAFGRQSGRWLLNVGDAPSWEEGKSGPDPTPLLIDGTFHI